MSFTSSSILSKEMITLITMGTFSSVSLLFGIFDFINSKNVKEFVPTLTGCITTSGCLLTTTGCLTTSGCLATTPTNSEEKTREDCDREYISSRAPATMAGGIGQVALVIILMLTYSNTDPTRRWVPYLIMILFFGACLTSIIPMALIKTKKCYDNQNMYHMIITLASSMNVGCLFGLFMMLYYAF